MREPPTHEKATYHPNLNGIATTLLYRFFRSMTSEHMATSIGQVAIALGQGRTVRRGQEPANCLERVLTAANVVYIDAGDLCEDVRKPHHAGVVGLLDMLDGAHTNQGHRRRLLCTPQLG